MKKESVEDMVLEVKDKSELMVDLAYSSLIYDNKNIAREVYDLEDLIDQLFQKIQKKSFENVKNKKLTVEDAVTLLRLAECGETISDSAQDIADVVLRDVELHPILKASIRESDDVFSRVEVKENSVLCGHTFGELNLQTETGMNIIAMRHGNRWLYDPGKNTRIDHGDILFAKGPEEGEKHLIELANGETDEI